MALGYLHEQRRIAKRTLPAGLSAKVEFAKLRIAVTKKTAISGLNSHVHHNRQRYKKSEYSHNMQEVVQEVEGAVQQA